MDKAEARALPIRLLKCLTSSLDGIELSIHVKECLPIVCEAAQLFLHALEVPDNHDDASAAVESSRTTLIETLIVLADEVRLCPPAMGLTRTRSSLPGRVKPN